MSDSWDLSKTSSSASGLLQALSPEDLQVIDEIVDRIPHDVGSFPLAFKAYGEVMRERGLDQASDIDYYRVLLKLSMIKGNWRDKWASAKAGLDHQHTTSSAGPKTPGAVLPEHWNPRAASPTPRPRRIPLISGDTPTFTPSSSTSAQRWALPEPSPQPAARVPATRSGAQDAKHRLQQLVKSHAVVSPSEPAPPLSAKGKERETELPATSVLDLWQLDLQADEFRANVLLQKCWTIWRAGFSWSHTTGEQVHAARVQLVAHKCLLHWHKSYLRHQSLMETAVQTDNQNLVRRAMRAWVARCRQKLYHKMRVQEWRMDMRRRMAAVQGARHQRLVSMAFTTWRLGYLSVVCTRLQELSIVQRVFRTWRHAQSCIHHLETVATQVIQERDNRLLSDVFELWRLSRELESDRQRFEEWTGNRLLRRSIRVWRAHAYEQKRVDAVRASSLTKKLLAKWIAALAKRRAQEHRAVRWSARRDKLLVYACARVWIARERGQLLQRVRNVRATRDYLHLWTKKLDNKRALEAQADAFSRLHATPLLRGAITWWRGKFRNLQRVELFSVEYYAARLTIRTLAKWKRALAVQVETEQLALYMHRQFLARRFFKRWKEVVKKRKLKAAWRTLKRRHARAWFNRWLHLERMNRASRVRGDQITMRAVLSTWISRVVALKEREIDVQEDADRYALVLAFDRWRGKFEKLQEDISLLENFMLIRQQNVLRAAFEHWNHRMHRLRYLVQAEEAVSTSVSINSIYLGWDTWRARFLERRLEPLEEQFQLQMQTNLRFLFFSRWYARTTALPAIHFRVTYLKQKTWQKWKAAMAPALQLKRAREMHRRAVLINAFEKWQAAYKAAFRRRATAKRDWVLPSLQGTSLFHRRLSPAVASPFTSSSSPIARFPIPPKQAPPSPSPPPRPITSITRRPSLSGHVIEIPRRPRSANPASSASRPPAPTTTLFSRPLSRAAGISASVTTASDSDGLWKQLHSERGLRGGRTDSRGGSPAP